MCREVEDASEELEISVLDDNGGNDYEFLGKVVILLLGQQLDGADQWHRLKKENLRSAAHGVEPRILLRIRSAGSRLSGRWRGLNEHF